VETLWIEPRTNSWRTCARGLKNICSESYIQFGRRLGDGKVSFYALATPSSPGPAIRCWKCSDFGVSFPPITISFLHDTIHGWEHRSNHSLGLVYFGHCELQSTVHPPDLSAIPKKCNGCWSVFLLHLQKTSKIKASTNSTSHKLVFRNPGNIHQLYSDKW